MVSQVGVLPADCVEASGLAGPVAGDPVQVEGLDVMAEGVAVTVLYLEQPGEPLVDASLAGVVAELLEQGERLS
jgi:hypothetical protein